MKYIAYGSNMVREQMAYRCPDAKLIGTGHIEGAQLEFYLHATVERSQIQGARVPVAVWDISKADERLLDLYEGYPDYYVKRRWPVRMDDGSEIKGMVYLMRLMRTAPPTASYYNGIRDAYVALGLSSEISGVLVPALRRSLERARL
jgi:gamma-glutamylcyclotransferase (GGCT)/AIG2-like uncharacterized protein YtfP